jgi:two-component system sensor histidine kinase/response regulator
VMLTSVGQSADLLRRHGNDIDAFLTKPIEHSRLLEALARIFGVATRQGRSEPTAERIGSRPRRALRVLVAEDNVVNRKLVTTLLRKRGHHVKAVENGRKAVASLESRSSAAEPFDLVLMDLQMPEMGGLEAAHAIRAREAEGTRRLPLIALTAHAMRGDRERCLAAGFDGYLSKPLDVDELIATVERLGAKPPSDRSDPGERRAIVRIFDERAALVYSGGDRRLLKNVIKLFRSDYPSSLRRIDQSLRRRDPEALRLAAHALKGAIATVGGSAGRQAAAELERAAHLHSFEDATRAYTNLRHAIARLEEEFVSARLSSPLPRRATVHRVQRSPQRKRRRS